MKKTQKPGSLGNEIIALIFFTLALVIFLSLISYNPEDPSFFFYNSNPQKIDNFLGVVGSYLSALLFQVLGLSSFLLVLLALQVSIRLFLTFRFPLRLLDCFSWVGLILSASGILSLTLQKVPLGKDAVQAGGFLGHVVSWFLLKYVNVIGSYIVLLLVFILSLMASTGFSFFRAGTFLTRFLVRISRSMERLAATGRGLFQKANKKQKVLSSKTKAPPSPAAVNEIHKVQREPTIVTDVAYEKTLPSAAVGFPEREKEQPLAAGFRLPPLSLLQDPMKEVTPVERAVFVENSRLLETKLADYGVLAKVVNVHPGPVITRYELEPAPGVKINRIVNLSDDLALALRAVGIRILAPIPGKAAIGVEIPNKKRETVYFKEIVGREEFLSSNSTLTLGFGKDISGIPVIADLSDMPHLLIAGTTGSGKSVFINSLICSILYKALPSEVRLLIMDPKRSELTFYNDIPHLLYPVVIDAKQAAEVLRWSVEEMERRYHLLAKMGARDIGTYNKKVSKSSAESKVTASDREEAQSLCEPQKMPWIVIVIDELANLMMVSSREVEWSLARLAQMARAAGIHLLVATQRPSVDIITGTIKANFPARISFRLASKTDSRIIIDTNGAENLLNQGDMLFLSPRTARLKRIQGPYISDDEILRVVDFLKAQATPDYEELTLESAEEEYTESVEDTDEKYKEAVTLVSALGQASISLVQRKLRIGYNRAARIIEKMEEDGIVGPSDGVKPREVLRKMVDI